MPKKKKEVVKKVTKVVVKITKKVAKIAPRKRVYPKAPVTHTDLDALKDNEIRSVIQKKEEGWETANSILTGRKNLASNQTIKDQS